MAALPTTSQCWPQPDASDLEENCSERWKVSEKLAVGSKCKERQVSIRARQFLTLGKAKVGKKI